MRAIADENIPEPAVRLLRAAGHNVAWVAEDAPSIPDEEVLAQGILENRVVLTYDKEDYGALIYRDRKPAHCGIVLFRFRNTTVEAQARFIAGILSNEAMDWRGNFTTIRFGPVPPLLP